MFPSSAQTLDSSSLELTSKRSILFAALALLVGLHFIPILLEIPAPGTDVFLFKEAGINFAQSGRFVAKNLPHQPSGKVELYAYYPPVYPFLFGVWSRVTGVGLFQSLAFDNLIRIIRTLLAFLLILPAFRSQREKSQLIFAAVVLFVWSFFTTDSDRPDDLSLVWGLLAWHTLFSRPTRPRVLMAGALLGLCAATSPTGGLFFTAVAVGSLLLNGIEFQTFVNLFILGATAFSVYVGCNLPIYLGDPLAYARFKKQVPLSTFPYLIPWRLGWGWLAAYFKFRGYMYDFVDIGAGILSLLAACLLTAVPAAFKRPASPPGYPYRYLALMSVCFLPLCIFVWSLQPYYLWFSVTGLLIAGLALMPRLENPVVRRWAKILMIAGLLPLGLREFKVYSGALQRPGSDSARHVQERVLPYLPPHASLAVSPDQFFTFRSVREVANVYYVCDRLSEFNYVYVTRSANLSTGAAEPTPIPCAENTQCFAVVRDFSSPELYSFFGIPLPYYIRGNGGVLYHNTCSS